MQTFVQDCFFHQSLIKVYHYHPFVCFVGKVFFFFFFDRGFYTIEILINGRHLSLGCDPAVKNGSLGRGMPCLRNDFFLANKPKNTPIDSMFKGESVWVNFLRMNGHSDTGDTYLNTWWSCDNFEYMIWWNMTHSPRQIFDSSCSWLGPKNPHPNLFFEEEPPWIIKKVGYSATFISCSGLICYQNHGCSNVIRGPFYQILSCNLV